MTDPSVIAASLARVAPRLGSGQVSGVTRLSGGASQETWAFEVAAQRYILRRAPGGAPATLSAQAIGLEMEARVIEAARAQGAPAPAVATVLHADDGLGPGYVMTHVAGETIARRIQRDAAFAEARTRLAAECGAALARIHHARADGLDALPVADARAQLDLYEETYRSYAVVRPIFNLAFATLRAMAPPIPAAVLCHGDFRLGNLMVTPEGLAAVLDWELAHWGDPHEDFGWLCAPSWRFGQIDQEAGGIGALQDMITGYVEAGGPARIDPSAVRFWTMFSALKWGVMCLTMYRTFATGADPSVERAAIGRRASETELDLILMLQGKL